MKNTLAGLANAVCEIIAESINHIKWPIKVFNQKLILRYLVNELYIMMLNQNLTPCMVMMGGVPQDLMSTVVLNKRYSNNRTL